jgi:Protein of unknown function (DUF2905)
VPLGRILIVVGIGIALIGALITFAPGLVSWFGRLPGDIRIEGERWTVFIPITSMLLVSLAITLVAGLVSRFMGR